MDWEAVAQFFTAVPWWQLVLIFVLKNIEVSFGTLRMILVNKGYRIQSVFLSLIEIFMWVFIASSVINDLSVAPIKGIVYGFGFASGIYVGSIMESKLAFGMVLIETIASQSTGAVITERLREIGYGVTTILGQGRAEKRLVIKVFAPRRNADNVTKEILAVDPAAMIVCEDIKQMTGGYVARSRSLFK
jgi:uncharacterized protein YebE (UPF0316 family)